MGGTCGFLVRLWLLLLIIGVFGLRYFNLSGLAGKLAAAGIEAGQRGLERAAPGGWLPALEAAAADRPAAAAAVFAAVYLPLRCCGLSGCTALAVLAGRVFGPPSAAPLVCCLAAAGSGACHLLSARWGRQAVRRYLADRHSVLCPMLRRAAAGEGTVDGDGGGVLRLLLYLRVFPLSTGWVLDYVGPHAGVPLWTQAAAALVGSIPHSVVATALGPDIASGCAWEGRCSTAASGRMSMLAAAALAPLLLRRYNQLKAQPVYTYSDFYAK